MTTCRGDQAHEVALIYNNLTLITNSFFQSTPTRPNLPFDHSRERRPCTLITFCWSAAPKSPSTLEMEPLTREPSGTRHPQTLLFNHISHFSLVSLIQPFYFLISAKAFLF